MEQERDENIQELDSSKTCETCEYFDQIDIRPYESKCSDCNRSKHYKDLYKKKL